MCRVLSELVFLILYFLIQCFLDLGWSGRFDVPVPIDIPASPMPAAGQFACCDWLVYRAESDLKYNLPTDLGSRVKAVGNGRRAVSRVGSIVRASARVISPSRCP